MKTRASPSHRSEASYNPKPFVGNQSLFEKPETHVLKDGKKRNGVGDKYEPYDLFVYALWLPLLPKVPAPKGFVRSHEIARKWVHRSPNNTFDDFFEFCHKKQNHTRGMVLRRVIYLIFLKAGISGNTYWICRREWQSTRLAKFSTEDFVPKRFREVFYMRKHKLWPDIMQPNFMKFLNN